MHIGDRAIGMLEPKYLSLIRRLKKLDPATYTVPFFPYVGRDYDDAKHRILIIGKATYGWGKGDKGQGSGTLSEVLNMEDVLDREDRAYRHLVKLPKEFIENEIIPFYGGEKGHYYSQFWNRTYRLAGNFLCDRQVSDYKRDRHMSEKCFRAIAWSNVFKVGAPKVKRGNPNKELISVQKKENTLKEELEMLEPDVVVFSTGRGYDDHLRDFLPITSMSATAPNHLGIKEIEIEGLRASVFRTYHFQYYSNQRFEQVVDHIRRQMNGSPANYCYFVEFPF